MGLRRIRGAWRGFARLGTAGRYFRYALHYFYIAATSNCGMDMSKFGLNPYERAEGDAMRRWYFPMTVVGLGGLGMLLFTDRGRRVLGWVAEHLPEAPRHLAEWNETAQHELDRIQATLDEVSKSLGATGDLVI